MTGLKNHVCFDFLLNKQSSSGNALEQAYVGRTLKNNIIIIFYANILHIIWYTMSQKQIDTRISGKNFINENSQNKNLLLTS